MIKKDSDYALGVKQPRNDRERGLHERARTQDLAVDCGLTWAPLPMLDKNDEPTTVQWPFCLPDNLASLKHSVWKVL